MLQGSQLEVLGGRQHQCSLHSAVLKGSGIEHSNRVGPAGVRGLFVEVSDTTEAELCDAVGAVDAVCYNDATTRHLVRRIGRELRLEQSGASLFIDGLLFELLGTLVRKIAAETARPADRRLQRAIDYLESNYRRRISYVEISAYAEIHPSSLALLFRQRYGASIGEWLRNRRLEHARAALSGGTASISAIAFQAGFADQSHLTRLFRARFGVTPAEYRRDATRRGFQRRESFKKCV